MLRLAGKFCPNHSCSSCLHCDAVGLNIRPFRNVDLPALVRIWVEHWSAAGPPPYVNQPKFEQAVLSRTFFDPETLLVAETDNELVGWCHFSGAVKNSLHHEDDVTLVHALCLSSSSNDAVALGLLAAIEKSSKSTSHLRVGVVRDDQRGYAGLEPIGYGIGIPVSDYRSSSFLQQAGYAPGMTHLRMVATVPGYRPPVNRSALQFRRNTQIAWTPTLPTDHRLAASLGHLDIESAELLERGGSSLSAVSIWFSDPEAEVMSPSTAILDLQRQHENGSLIPADSYLIGALVHSLNQRNIQTVETTIDSDRTELIDQLQTLQFRVVDEGTCWTKTSQSA